MSSSSSATPLALAPGPGAAAAGTAPAVPPSMTVGPVGATLVRLAVPMLAALLAMIGYSVAETWFIARLGPHALAAVSFTFPVTMVVISLAIGLGAGTSAVVARTMLVNTMLVNVPVAWLGGRLLGAWAAWWIWRATAPGPGRLA